MQFGPSMKRPISLDKHARVVNLRRSTYTTTRAAAALLKAARDDGIPDHISESTQHRYRRAMCARETPYGTLVQDLALPHVNIAVQNPLAMLHISVQESEPLARCISDAINAYGQPSPEEPWRLIWYHDEIGISPLAAHDSKKTLGCYWSFVEFGTRLLCNENLWFVMATVRSDIISSLPGGISHLVKLLLHMFFTSENGNLRTGICLHLKGHNTPLILFAELFMVAADLDGIFKFLCSMGANANVPCPMCTNIVSIKCGWARAGNVLRALDHLDKTEIMFHTDDSIRNALRALRAAARNLRNGLMEKGDFELMEQDLGFRHHEDNVVLDDQLNVNARSVLHIDWFHTYMQTGIFNYELAAIIKFLDKNKPHRISIDMMRDFVDRYTPPRHFGVVSHLINPNCISKGGVHFKCSASEGLTLYPILALFFNEVVLPLEICVPQVTSFLALCDTIDLLCHVQEGLVTPDQLDKSITKHAELCKAAYGNLLWVYKHHAAAIHLADQFRRHGLLVSLFTHERRHKLPKRFIKDRRKLSGFERGVIEECTCQHLYDLQSELLICGLHMPHDPKRSQGEALFANFPDATSFKVAAACSLSTGAVAKVGDVVAFRHGDDIAIGELWTIFRITHVDDHVDDAVCISKWNPMGAVTSTHYRNYVMIDDPTFGLLECVLAPMHVSKNTQSNLASCIIPAPLRSSFRH